MWSNAPPPTRAEDERIRVAKRGPCMVCLLLYMRNLLPKERVIHRSRLPDRKARSPHPGVQQAMTQEHISHPEGLPNCAAGQRQNGPSSAAGHVEHSVGDV